MQAQQGALNPTTTSFQLSIPRVLQQASPALASLHASRFRLLHYPDASSAALSDSHCLKCGAFLCDGSGSFRSVRPKRKKPKGGVASSSNVRVLRKSCNICGHNKDISVDESNATLFKRVGKRRESTLLQSENDRVLQSAPITPATSGSEPPKQLEQSTKDIVHQKPSPSSTPSSQSQSRSRTPSSTVPTPESKSAKARPKKKGGLQEMLARNRERQEQEKKKQASGGLSAFLEGL